VGLQLLAHNVDLDDILVYMLICFCQCDGCRYYVFGVFVHSFVCSCMCAYVPNKHC